ncbi:sugar isomerase domain-containing protein [Nonomuraea sediminis]|uniref:sugar isomerase domain-containing protein n=1 Tax=Nonomuraea sediminis TaxID=2835864 RepID=UPI001BDD1D71|nr:SIS domain-containing protein [Nonomuraea sediminis]
MQLSSEAFVLAVQEAVTRVAESQRPGVLKAAGIIVQALRAEGVVHAFGTGHSEAFAMEIAGRAGGLVPTNRLSLRDLVLIGGDSPQVLTDPFLERDPGTARRIYDLAPVRPGDVFMIASNSGVNGCVVELARLAKQNAHPLIVVTSLDHTHAVESRHPSGRRLADFADVVLDNGAPYGDAVLPLPTGGAACGLSSITAALLGQMIVAEVLRELLAEGARPPVYLSANVPGGDAHNRELEARYAGRLVRMA